jgi:oligo-1,6-glucosidase
MVISPTMIILWVSKFGNDSKEISSSLLFILTERNAFYYQGDELGMVNPRFNSIDEYQDLETQIH